jgi:hypothetical protein
MPPQFEKGLAESEIGNLNLGSKFSLLSIGSLSPLRRFVGVD